MGGRGIENVTDEEGEAPDGSFVRCCLFRRLSVRVLFLFYKVSFESLVSLPFSSTHLLLHASPSTTVSSSSLHRSQSPLNLFISISFTSTIMSATEATTAPAVEKVETAPVETKAEETKPTEPVVEAAAATETPAEASKTEDAPIAVRFLYFARRLT
ncbi:hypothetical protein M407DRAFT_137621 [Tulasnella calospora MUT 4182]|uniref:Uncharacterized protein n=1 Tax=Tulasnella calospora MUT 4182 TaxID=1051891 RepID=A0A0C3Q954_9AGAM|nr:hypothetical protein M407DRAFT_137621 [Tulasnella calospora MUT 4182]